MNRYEALKIAVEAHAGQKDKCGRDYILHPLAVAEAVAGPWGIVGANNTYGVYGPQGIGEGAVRVALLHDVLEDTDHRIDQFELSPGEWHSLRCLTRNEGESYADYIERVAGDTLASFVKLADLWHNLSPERQDCLPASERKGLEKRYLKARDRIWEALGYEWWPGEGKG